MHSPQNVARDVLWSLCVDGTMFHIFAHTGTQLEVTKLMGMVPSLKDMRSNWGRWKPVLTSDILDDRIPPAAVLHSCKFWKDTQSYGHIHALLKTPPMKVDISTSEEHVKLEITGTGASVIVVNNKGGMPVNLGTFPTRCIIIDARSMSTEEGRLVERVPGRSRFTEIPVVMFGGQREVDEVIRSIRRSTGDTWMGQIRTFDVATSEATPMYSATRRRLTLMVPENIVLKKFFPFLDMTSASDASIGWVTVTGLFNSVWRQRSNDEAVGAEDTVEWLQVISDDADFVVHLVTKLEGSPSVIHCPLHPVASVEELGDVVCGRLSASEAHPPISWLDVNVRWADHVPLFTRTVGAPEAEDVSSDDDHHESPLPQAVQTPPTPKPKPKAKPRSKPKAKAKASATPAQPTAEEPTGTATPVLTVPTEKVSGSKSSSTSSSNVPLSKRRKTTPSKDQDQRQKEEEERQRHLLVTEQQASRQRKYRAERERLESMFKEREREQEAMREQDRTEREREQKRERDNERDREKQRERERERQRQRERERGREREADREPERDRIREEERVRRFGRQSESSRDADRRRVAEERGRSPEHRVVRTQDTSRASSSTDSRARRPMSSEGVRHTLGPHRRR